MSFWEFLWSTTVVFAFVAYLIVLFSIVGDLIRDNGLSGWWKAAWIVFLVFLPFLTALAYLVFRGPLMAERRVVAVSEPAAAQQGYFESVVAASTPADQIARVKQLLGAGTISPEEFDILKAKALA